MLACSFGYIGYLPYLKEKYNNLLSKNIITPVA